VLDASVAEFLLNRNTAISDFTESLFNGEISSPIRPSVASRIAFAVRLTANAKDSATGSRRARSRPRRRVLSRFLQAAVRACAFVFAGAIGAANERGIGEVSFRAPSGAAPQATSRSRFARLVKSDYLTVALPVLFSPIAVFVSAQRSTRCSSGDIERRPVGSLRSARE